MISVFLDCRAAENGAVKKSVHTFLHQDTHFHYVIIRPELPNPHHHEYKHYTWKKIDEGYHIGKWKGVLKPESVLNFTA